MQIRFVREQDTPQVKALWAEAFGDKEPYFSWYFNDIYRPERTLAALDGQQMLASLQIAPYTLMLDKSPLPALFIVGVCTGEAYRHQGIGHALLRYTLQQVSGGPYALALLNTDIPAYYQPLGFTHCYSLRRITLPAEQAPLPPHWQWLGQEDELSPLQRIYTKMGEQLDGWVQRTPANWRCFCRDLYTEPTASIYLSKHAYAMCWVERNQLLVRELGYTGRPALSDALQFLARLAASCDCDSFRWDAPQAAPLIRQRNEPQLPYVMARRLDIPAELAGEQAAIATRELLKAPRPDLWISEIT